MANTKKPTPKAPTLGGAVEELEMVDVLVPGHRYRLHSQDGGKTIGVQEIQFIEKDLATIMDPPVKTAKGWKQKSHKEFITLVNGTTNEAVLEMLIHRVSHLNEKMPCDENAETIKHLEAALKSQHARIARRKSAKVLGTGNPDPKDPTENGETKKTPPKKKAAPKKKPAAKKADEPDQGGKG